MPLPPVPRFNLLGTGISAVNLSTAEAAVLAALKQRDRACVSTADVRAVSLAAEDPEFRLRLNNSLLTTPDGMPLVWLGRLLGHRSVGRVYGPDLMLSLCAATAGTAHAHFFYGGAPGVAEALAARLQQRFPGLRIVGAVAPPFRALTDAEEAVLVARVAAAKPDLFWVGLGLPERERFMAQMLPRFEPMVMLGVGAAFDLLSGRVRQAPRWIQRSGFEWLFRLGLEPRRLAPRYFRHLPRFILGVSAQLTGLRKFPSSRTQADDPCLRS
jgi:N-acetylglucosaminyldiphosphoundecaprenol N-acetyl-beta-D-mannosaminyltransferase